MAKYSVNMTEAEMRAVLGDKFEALQSIARRLYVRKTAKDLRLFTALVETIPAEARQQILAAVVRRS